MGMEQIILTDSRCVLEWYRSTKELKKFVINRMKEIRSYNVRIGYVKSKDNPADIATRGISIKDLINCKMWWEGPAFMANSDNLPVQIYEIDDDIQSAVVNKEKGSKILHEVALTSTNDIMSQTLVDINEERFSSYCKLIRVTAWCNRFMKNFIKGCVNQGNLRADEIEEAATIWTKCIQRKNFVELFSCLDNNKRHSLYNLGVFEDTDGILKCKGRFQNMERNSLILLPKHVHYTKLIIMAAHRRMLHAGVAQTLAEIRESSWIIQGRSAVRKVLRQCLICIHWEGGPFKTPPFAPLPEYVVCSDNRIPFMFVGIDYLGPLFVNDGNNREKNWIGLFTCLNIRAIHLELIENMSALDGLLQGEGSQE